MVEELYDVLAEDGGAGGFALRVHVQPAGGRTAVVGRHGNALKVRVAAPPEGGRANEACARLLSETFGVASAEVELLGGTSSRLKRFRVGGLEVDEFRRLLERAVEGAATAERGRGGRGSHSATP